MGSLNDIYFDHRYNRNIPPGYTADQANKELDKLLDIVFMEYRLLDTSIIDRLKWWYYRFKYRKNPPPRVINSFRNIGQKNINAFKMK